MSRDISEFGAVLISL